MFDVNIEKVCLFDIKVLILRTKQKTLLILTKPLTIQKVSPTGEVLEGGNYELENNA